MAGKRSRRSEREAGGADRRAGDDGGHYVAVRFNGPRDAFNHFAQDASFNRGAYRALEDKLAGYQRAGKRVSVRIVPSYQGISQRPYVVDFGYTVDGSWQWRRFPNARREK